MTLEQRIRADIENEIRSGAWPPGQRIPFEHELSTQYACSRATVSKALAPLARDGLIERRRKAGSFVAQPRIDQAVMEIEDFSRRFGARDYRFELLRRRTDRGQTLIVTGLHRVADTPIAFERRRIHLAAAPTAAQATFESEPPGAWLLRHVPWSEAEHVIAAVAADAATARLLGIDAGAPCLSLDRTTWRAGRKVTQACFIYPGDRYRLSGRFTPTLSAAPARRR